MTWLLPSALAIAAGAAILVAALHFIARSRPLAEPLPTARFVPVRPVQARTRSIALTDVLLLLIRIAAVLAIGFAIAGPIFTGRGRAAHIVLVDRSRSVSTIAELRDSARALAQTADVVIPFDSSASAASSRASVDSMTLSGARGSLSAALASAMGAVAQLPASSDSVELVLVSPVDAEELDAATLRLRAVWPGRVRIVRVASVVTQPAALRVALTAPANDAVAAGLSLTGVVAGDAPVRVVRGRLAPTDSLWATTGGHVLVHWPASDTSATWAKRATIDAIGGVASASGTLVARFPRVWALTGQAVARWADGEPAAVEHRTGDGCIRDVGILIDESSDVTLHPTFRRFVAALLEPCGGRHLTAPASTSTIASLAGRGPLAATTLLRDRVSDASRWSTWLLALGALLLIGELALRRTKAALA